MIRTLLFDADGVVQTTPAIFFESLSALVGEENAARFREQVFAAELPCLTGQANFTDELDKILRQWQVQASNQEVIELWHHIEPHEGMLTLVASLRAAGYQCCLATNQQSLRAQYMQQVLGYAEHFDQCFYSCEVGAAKPDVNYFSRLLERLKVDAEKVLFIDDNHANLESAASIGIEVLHFDLAKLTSPDVSMTQHLNRYDVVF